MAPSSCRDRTGELHAIVDRLRKSQSSLPISNSNGHSNGIAPLPRQYVSAQSEFNHRASGIGLKIHQTSQKLSKLAKLAKKTSMFDDPAVEIQELTALIKEDITGLNADIADLQSFCDTQNGTGNISKQSTEHSTTVVDNLKSRLMNATKEFKEVLTMRTENLKVHENRRQMYSSTLGKERENSLVRHRASTSNGGAMSSSAAPPPWASGSASSSPLLGSRRLMNGENSSLQQQALVPLQDTYMQSRAEALQNVESTILELGNIFTQLATMVAQQGEVAIRIDENIDDTLANVEGAQGALLKYLNSISSNRWLVIKIFCILVVFLLIFVVFVA